MQAAEAGARSERLAEQQRQHHDRASRCSPVHPTDACLVHGLLFCDARGWGGDSTKLPTGRDEAAPGERLIKKLASPCISCLDASSCFYLTVIFLCKCTSRPSCEQGSAGSSSLVSVVCRLRASLVSTVTCTCDSREGSMQPAVAVW